MGATTQLDHLGGQCFDVVNQWWQDPLRTVVRHADIQLTDCCSETLRTTSAGRTFTNTPFQRNFYLPDRPAAPVTQRGDCNVALSCTPATLTRGQNTTCTASVTGAPPEALIRYTWRFSDGTTTVNGPDGIGSRTWSGTMVTSGTVYVRVRVGTARRDIEKSATLTVNNRNWHTSPASPVEVPNGTFITLPVPPEPMGKDAGLGAYQFRIAHQRAWSPISDGGPNHGFTYYTFLTFPEFFFRYTINPDLMNSASEFSQHQCGNYDPIRNPTGFISRINLLTHTRRHEYDSVVQSHHAFYSISLNSPLNNLGDYVEARVAPPGIDFTRFNDDTRRELEARVSRIATDTDIEPFPVNFSETGVFLGNINYRPYTPCN